MGALNGSSCRPRDSLEVLSISFGSRANRRLARHRAAACAHTGDGVIDLDSDGSALVSSASEGGENEADTPCTGDGASAVHHSASENAAQAAAVSGAPEALLPQPTGDNSNHTAEEHNMNCDQNVIENVDGEMFHLTLSHASSTLIDSSCTSNPAMPSPSRRRHSGEESLVALGRAIQDGLPERMTHASIRSRSPRRRLGTRCTPVVLPEVFSLPDEPLTVPAASSSSHPSSTHTVPIEILPLPGEAVEQRHPQIAEVCFYVEHLRTSAGAAPCRACGRNLHPVA